MGQEISYVFNGTPITIKNNAQVEQQHQQAAPQSGVTNVFGVNAGPAMTGPAMFGYSPIFEANSRIPGFAGDLVFAGEMMALQQMPNVFLAQMFGLNISGQQGQIQNGGQAQGNGNGHGNGCNCDSTKNSASTGTTGSTGAATTGSSATDTTNGSSTAPSNSSTTTSNSTTATAPANTAASTSGTDNNGKTTSTNNTNNSGAPASKYGNGVTNEDGTRYTGDALDRNDSVKDANGNTLYKLKGTDYYVSEEGQTVEAKPSPTEHWLTKQAIASYGIDRKDTIKQQSVAAVIDHLDPAISDADKIKAGQKIFIPAHMTANTIGYQFNMKPEFKNSRDQLQAECDKVSSEIHARGFRAHRRPAETPAPTPAPAAAPTLAPAKAETPAKPAEKPVDYSEKINVAKYSRAIYRTRGEIKAQELRKQADAILASGHGSKALPDDGEKVQLSTHSRVTYITKGQQRARAEAAELRRQADAIIEQSKAQKK